MNYYVDEITRLLEEFDSAFSMQCDIFSEIKDYIYSKYNGDTERFLLDVAHSCDYFSLEPILRTFIEKWNI